MGAGEILLEFNLTKCWRVTHSALDMLRASQQLHVGQKHLTHYQYKPALYIGWLAVVYIHVL